jgi:hypothetical protein
MEWLQFITHRGNWMCKADILGEDEVEDEGEM